MNPYQVLRVKKRASDKTISAAYRRRVLEAHPDRNSGDRTDYDQVELAFRVLSDPAARQHFDATGECRPTPLDTVKHQALAFLYALLGGIIGELVKSGANIEHEDMADHLRKSIRATSQKMKDQIRTAERAALTLEVAEGRFVAPDGDSILDALIRNHREDVVRQIEAMKSQMAIHDKALEIAEAHSFTHRAKRAASHMATTMTATAWSVS